MAVIRSVEGSVRGDYCGCCPAEMTLISILSKQETSDFLYLKNVSKQRITDIFDDSDSGSMDYHSVVFQGGSRQIRLFCGKSSCNEGSRCVICAPNPEIGLVTYLIYVSIALISRLKGHNLTRVPEKRHLKNRRTSKGCDTS